MDSTKTPAVGRTGRNCSRSDGIRGGAVTGPWRSTGNAAAQARTRPAPRAVEATPPAPPAADIEEVPPPASTVIEAPSVSDQMAQPAAAARPRSQRALWIWTLFGAATAAALIGLALAFRPQTPAPQPEPEIATPQASDLPAPAMAPAEAAAEAEATAPDQPPALTPATVTVNVRVAPDTPRERQDKIVAVLRSAGYQSIKMNIMPFPILRSRVGYFTSDDRAAAEALVSVLASVPEATGGPLPLRDYGPLEVPNAAGRLDLWIGE